MSLGRRAIPGGPRSGDGAARKLLWLLMLVFAAAVAAYASAALLSPALRSAIIRDRLVTLPVAMVFHLVGGAAVLVVGALQHNGRLRTRHPGLHRWCGRVYVAGVTIGGVAALRLATESVGGPVTHVGFGLLGLLWIGTTLEAFRQIRAGHREAHRTWMLRSYGLTLAAVTLRVYLAASQVAGLPYEPSYQAISWLCWVPNLLVVEWYRLASARADGERRKS